jgi:hypothetical protein
MLVTILFGTCDLRFASSKPKNEGRIYLGVYGEIIIFGSKTEHEDTNNSVAMNCKICALQ